jgi:hypothetical protein
MNKRMAIYIVLINITFSIIALPSEGSYFCVQKWYYRADEQAGEIRTQLKLFQINEYLFEISIQKDMTPFPEKLLLTTRATYNKGKYEFHCIDGWGNIAFGYFIIKNDEEVILYLDCDDFSETGKNLGRLYGDTKILTKGTILFK